MVFVEFDNSEGSGSFIGDVTSFTAERTFVVVYHLDWVVEFSERFNSQKNDIKSIRDAKFAKSSRLFLSIFELE